MIHELLHCLVILVYKSNYRKKWGLKSLNLNGIGLAVSLG